MAINLTKGQTIDLRKNDKGENIYDLSSVTIGLGWDVRQKQAGFLGKIFGGKEEEYDLDAIAFLLDSNGNKIDEVVLGSDSNLFFITKIRRIKNQYESGIYQLNIRNNTLEEEDKGCLFNRIGAKE